MFDPAIERLERIMKIFRLRLGRRNSQAARSGGNESAVPPPSQLASDMEDDIPF